MAQVAALLESAPPGSHGNGHPAANTATRPFGMPPDAVSGHASTILPPPHVFQTPANQSPQHPHGVSLTQAATTPGGLNPGGPTVVASAHAHAHARTYTHTPADLGPRPAAHAAHTAHATARAATHAATCTEHTAHTAHTPGPTPVPRPRPRRSSQPHATDSPAHPVAKPRSPRRSSFDSSNRTSVLPDPPVQFSPTSTGAHAVPAVPALPAHTHGEGAVSRPGTRPGTWPAAPMDSYIAMQTALHEPPPACHQPALCGEVGSCVCVCSSSAEDDDEEDDEEDHAPSNTRKQTAPTRRRSSTSTVPKPTSPNEPMPVSHGRGSPT